MDITDERNLKISAAFNELSAENMGVLESFYAPEVCFIDPLGKLEGREALKAYYVHLYANVDAITFDFDDIVARGDVHVAVWTMRLRAKKLNAGREVLLDGTSVLRFNANNQVLYHRDYFDMGAFIYEHIPVFGLFIKHVKKRLQHTQ